MSYCEIIPFRDGKPYHGVRFGNSWGGAARIWDALYNKYLKNPTEPYDCWMVNADPLWKLAKDKRLKPFEKFVHISTFDYAMIKRENFIRYINDLRDFVLMFPCTGVCHLSAWANWIESCDAEAIGFYHTSVGKNLWFEWDDEKDEETAYDLNGGNKHFEIYSYLTD